MSSTYSSNLRLELISSGEQANTWGNTTNTNLGTLLEQAVTGITDVDISGGNVTLTALNGAYDQARSAVITVSGAAGTTRTIFTPANVSKTYIVDNAASDDVIIITLAAGTPVGVTVPAGTAKLVYTDGTDFYEGSNAADVFTATDINADTVSATSVTISGSPSASTDAVTKGYADARYVQLAGSTMTGALILSGAPATALQAATKAYVDTATSGTAFPAGTRLLFQQYPPPTGWTADSSYNDYALRIVTGAVSNGGAYAFSSVFTAQTPTGSVSLSGLSIGATTLSTSQIPSHTHPASSDAFVITGNSNPQNVTGSGYAFSYSFNTGSSGGGGSHTHSIGGSATFSGNAMQFGVKYVDAVIGVKS